LTEKLLGGIMREKHINNPNLKNMENTNNVPSGNDIEKIYSISLPSVDENLLNALKNCSIEATEKALAKTKTSTSSLKN
jgi:hypothetical protein